MKNRSIWKENVKNNKLPSLNRDTTCDILIIGGGIAGLSTAYFLRNCGKNAL
jgi:heterodisulfide reductase subunit A-like polyferredoxin